MARNPQTHIGSSEAGYWCAPISTAVVVDPEAVRTNDLRKQGGSIGWSNFTSSLARDRVGQPNQVFTIGAGDYVINGVSASKPSTLTFNFPSSVNTTPDFAGFDHILIVYDRDGFTVWEIYDARRQGPNNWTCRSVCSYDARGDLHTPPGATFAATGTVSPALPNRPATGSRGRRFGNGGAGIPQGGLPTRSLLEAAMAINGDFGTSLALWMDNSQKGHTNADQVPSPTSPSSADWRGVSWPAFSNDFNSANANTGSIRQGSLIRLPPGFNVEAQSWSPELKVFARTAQRYGFITKEGAGGGNKIHTAAQQGEDAFTSAQASAVNSAMSQLFDAMEVCSVLAMQPSYFGVSGNRTKGNGTTLVTGASFPEAFEGETPPDPPAGNAGVRVNGVNFTTFNVDSAVQITGTTGALQEGVNVVQIEDDAGTINPPTAAAEIVGYAAPTVIGILPASGPLAAGTPVTITGTKFANPATGLTPGTFVVEIGGVACTSVVMVNSTTITAVAPAGSPGVEDVTVQTPGGTGTLSNGFAFQGAVAPFSAGARARKSLSAAFPGVMR